MRLGKLSQAGLKYVTRKLAGRGRLGRDQIWLPLGKSSIWTQTLLDVPHILAEVRARHEGIIATETRRTQRKT